LLIFLLNHTLIRIKDCKTIRGKYIKSEITGADKKFPLGIKFIKNKIVIHITHNRVVINLILFIILHLDLIIYFRDLQFFYLPLSQVLLNQSDEHYHLL